MTSNASSKTASEREADAFEQMCREFDIFGTAAARQCEEFWKAGARFASLPSVPEGEEMPEPTAQQICDTYYALLERSGGAIDLIEVYRAFASLSQCAALAAGRAEPEKGPLLAEFLAEAKKAGITHLAAPAQAAAVPEGWKLVPVEPTKAMRRAGGDYFTKTEGHWSQVAGGAYRAMLAAAPAQPAPEPAAEAGEVEKEVLTLAQIEAAIGSECDEHTELTGELVRICRAVEHAAIESIDRRAE